VVVVMHQEGRQPMNLGWIYDPRFLQHDTGPTHPERAERLAVILAAVREAGIEDRLVPLPFSAATPAQLALIHDPAYVDLVRMMCDEGFTFIGDRDTCIGPASYDVAALATGGVLAACDAVLAGRVGRAFCAVRPPGHHAEPDQALGFCLFNHVAIAAEHLIRHAGLARVAIVDFDVHHGNGTQHAFESRRDVMYISLHERPGSLPFPGSGHAEECGCGEGEGYTRNVPLDRGAGNDEYRAAMDQHVLPALEHYRPEFLLLSAGFDALAWDRVAHQCLRPESFGWLTERLVHVADRHAGGRLVSVLEGGYELGNLGRAVAAHLRALLAD
jgi:acetoin utilization deacetylase AcuC-like enzyme